MRIELMVGFLKGSLDESLKHINKLLIARVLVPNAYHNNPNMKIYIALNPSLLNLPVAGTSSFWFNFNGGYLNNFIVKADLLPIKKVVAKRLGRLKFNLFWNKLSKSNWNLILSPLDFYLSKDDKHITGHLYANRFQKEGLGYYDVYVPSFAMGSLGVVKPLFKLYEEFAKKNGFLTLDKIKINKYTDFIKNFNAGGILRNLNLHYQYPSLFYLKPHIFKLNLNLDNISFNKFSYFPGVDSLNGFVDFNNHGGNIVFDAKDIILPKQQLFPDGWPNTNISGKLSWVNTPKALSFNVPKVSMFNFLPPSKPSKKLILKKELLTHLSGNIFIPKDNIGRLDSKNTRVSLISESQGQNVAPIVPYLLPHNISKGLFCG